MERGSKSENLAMEASGGRGAGNQRFKRTMRELVQIHKPELLILMETKVEFKSMGMFFNCMGFTAFAHVDPIGCSGGIWMIWNPNMVNVRVVEASSQLITTTISRQDFPDWLLSAVYASLNNNKREELWEYLEAILQNMTDPWLVAGDFNDFSTSNEKRSFIGCSGPRLTWSNNQKGWANTMVRLDRAMCNTEWRTSFPDGAVHNLPHTYSDHSPMMVFTQGMSPFNPTCKLFKFLIAWITHDDFKSVVTKSWTNPHPSLLSKLETLAHGASV
ncbi:uncharacterized protein LOC114315507 [Camellia sinensis]|uniref:uncharacterized protein LOC114315507 n=1 Tax=Camellia sinensis TaxID=4442 RepID=UPI0010369DA7|nr:uncharacterized protein LOC114315507 [Camellia sinensis]